MPKNPNPKANPKLKTNPKMPNNVMKKIPILSVILIIAVILPLTACDREDKPQAGEFAPVTAESSRLRPESAASDESGEQSGGTGETLFDYEESTEAFIADFDGIIVELTELANAAEFKSETAFSEWCDRFEELSGDAERSAQEFADIMDDAPKSYAQSRANVSKAVDAVLAAVSNMQEAVTAAVLAQAEPNIAEFTEFAETEGIIQEYEAEVTDSRDGYLGANGAFTKALAKFAEQIELADKLWCEAVG